MHPTPQRRQHPRQRLQKPSLIILRRTMAKRIAAIYPPKARLNPDAVQQVYVSRRIVDAFAFARAAHAPFCQVGVERGDAGVVCGCVDFGLGGRAPWAGWVLLLGGEGRLVGFSGGKGGGGRRLGDGGWGMGMGGTDGCWDEGLALLRCGLEGCWWGDG